MAIINLRDVYPFYHSDLLVEVSEDVVEAMSAAARREASARRRMYRYKAQYSLDRGDCIEHSAVRVAPSPAELYEERRRSRPCMPPWPLSRKNRAAGCMPITYSVSARRSLRGPRVWPRVLSGTASAGG